jgi:carboxymethylenebutenolidase
MDQRIIAFYDDFTHRHLDRRLFLEQTTRLVGSAAAALAALSLLQSNRALGQIVAPSDKRLTTAAITFPGSTGAVKAYVARPAGAATLPGVVVIHENRGLMPHIQDVARRVALAGYVALAPDLMSATGGTPDDEEKARVELAALASLASAGAAAWSTTWQPPCPISAPASSITGARRRARMWRTSRRRYCCTTLGSTRP